jgi:hypothetical protein
MLFAMSIYLHLPLMLLVISLVYSATRHEQWDEILIEAFRWGIRMFGFMLMVAVVLFVVSLWGILVLAIMVLVAVALFGVSYLIRLFMMSRKSP